MTLRLRLIFWSHNSIYGSRRKKDVEIQEGTVTVVKEDEEQFMFP
jgi:hypothetical protein